MKAEFKSEVPKLLVAVKGNIDTITAPDLEKELKNRWEDISEIVFDFSEVDYISSAGLRVIMLAHRHTQQKGSLTIKNVKDDVKEVFEMTGFQQLLDVK